MGVETHLFAAHDCPSQQAFILVEPTGERTVLWKRDGRLTLLPEELDCDWILNARVLHLDGHDTAAATQAAQWARNAGIPVVADLDDLYAGYEALLLNIDFLITSRDIPARLSGDQDLYDSLPRIARRYGCRLAAATLGQEGVLAWDGKRFHYASAYSIDAVDTTCGRHLSCRFHLWFGPKLAHPATARICLRRCRFELHRHRCPRGNSVHREYRGSDGGRQSSCRSF
jgi:sulfofructose kinase